MFYDDALKNDFRG